MKKIKIFLASSNELVVERKEFEIFINRENNILIDKGIFLHLVIWEDFIDAMSKTRLQDEYNKTIRECDIFISMFFTKAGKYTEEEFETAFGHFQSAGKPLVYTYFKNANIKSGEIKTEDIISILNFKDKIKKLGHFLTEYEDINDLKYKFKLQLEKLIDGGRV